MTDKMQRWLPWAAALLVVGGTLARARAPSPVQGFDVAAAGRLPVLEGGRVKPLDSLARNTLLMIHSKQTLSFEGRSVGPDEWMLDVLFRPQVADRQPLFVIDDPDVLGLMGLPQTANRYYSFEALRPHLPAIQQQGEKAHPVDAKERTRFENAIVNLFDRLSLYYRLKNTVQPDDAGLAELAAAVNAPEVGPYLTEMAATAHFRP
ncbi:MAG: hypothetical protein RL199_1864, partial [Pseudomonadota bacterium]